MAITDEVLRALGAEMALARGHVVRVEADGRVRVRLDGDERAGLLCDVLNTGAERPQLEPNQTVLIARSQIDGIRAIVLGVIGAAAPAGEEAAAEPAAEGEEHRLTRRRIVIEAGEELTLQCGEASIKIRRDGKIVIRGEHILSRAKGTQRIKGGSVAIN